ncbi:GntR family transcriptional regulator [Chryseobacterium sp.]|uniref:GntR family transcriptional regulator n=1 Tax=Chryseobacterium sp. TaxID=1871047 RepID=UPI0028A14E8D|nr:GntR family transcriptional regulator [Chryseobacterium sp.]
MLRDWNFQIELKSDSDKPIYLQIADAIMNDIHSGRLKAGNALPGSRNLSQLLKVNRNTVVEALNILLNEGWLVSKERKGTFVADILPSKSSFQDKKEDKTSEFKQKNQFRIQFDDGYPDSKIAPIEELARVYRQIFNRKAKWQMMGYGDELGDIEFRRNIAQMLNHQRAMHTNEDQIYITNPQPSLSGGHSLFLNPTLHHSWLL